MFGATALELIMRVDLSHTIGDILNRLRQVRLVIAGADHRELDDIDTLLAVAESESRLLAARVDSEPTGDGASESACLAMPPLVGPRSTRDAWKTYAFWTISTAAEVHARHVDEILRLRDEVAALRHQLAAAAPVCRQPGEYAKEPASGSAEAGSTPSTRDEGRRR